MAEPEEGDLVKCVERLLVDKQAITAREKKLIEDLNTALEKMGYRVVPIKAAGTTGGTGKKRGRPPGSGKTPASKAAPAS